MTSELNTLPPLPKATAYVWHEHLGEKTASLRWNKPTQWDYTTGVEELFNADQLRQYSAALSQAQRQVSDEQIVSLLEKYDLPWRVDRDRFIGCACALLSLQGTGAHDSERAVIARQGKGD